WFDVSGEKLNSSVHLDFSQDAKGNLTGLKSVKYDTQIMTNQGGYKGVEYNKEGFNNGSNYFFISNSGTESIQWLSFKSEQHAKVPFLEELGIKIQGGNIVNVAQ